MNLSENKKDQPCGTHVLIDFCGLSWEVCTNPSIWLHTFESIAKSLKMEVLAKAGHIFEAPKDVGLTAFVLLDASHFSVHTYASWGLAAVDLFTCKRHSLSFASEELCKSLGLKSKNISLNKEFGRFIYQDKPKYNGNFK